MESNIYFFVRFYAMLPSFFVFLGAKEDTQQINNIFKYYVYHIRFGADCR